MAKLFGGRNKPDNKNIKQEKIEFFPGLIFTLSKEGQPAHTGKLLAKQGGDRLLFGVYADREYEFDYQINEVVSAAFAELRVLYGFNIRILTIREPDFDSGEGFDIDEAANKLESIYGYNKYIIEAIALDPPQKQQNRQFFRMTLRIDIFYKIIEEEDIVRSISSNLKFGLAAEAAAKEEGELNFLESEGGYLKLTTTDISAGGFKAKSALNFEENTLLDCIIIAGYEALPAIAKVLRTDPDPEDPGMYEIRAIFYEIGNPVRDRIVRFILEQQKLLRARFLGKR